MLVEPAPDSDLFDVRLTGGHLYDVRVEVPESSVNVGKGGNVLLVNLGLVRILLSPSCPEPLADDLELNRLDVGAKLPCLLLSLSRLPRPRASQVINQICRRRRGECHPMVMSR